MATAQLLERAPAAEAAARRAAVAAALSGRPPKPPAAPNGGASAQLGCLHGFSAPRRCGLAFNTECYCQSDMLAPLLGKLSTIGYLLQRLKQIPHGDATALPAAAVMASGAHCARAPTATKAAGTGWQAVAEGLAAATGARAAGRCVSPAHGLPLHRLIPSAHCPVSGSPSSPHAWSLSDVMLHSLLSTKGGLLSSADMT
jgi:hypothetical protein